MKTKISVKRILGGALTGLFILALGCSDGVRPSPEEQTPEIVAPLPPKINSFTATPDTIDRGGSTTLKWDVEGADKVEIVSSGTRTNFNFSSEDQFSGETPVSNIQETTTFILTATKFPGAPEPAEGEEGSEGEEPASGMVSASVAKEEAPANPEEGAEGETPVAEEPQAATQQATVKVTVRAGAGVVSIEEFYAEALESADGNSYLVDPSRGTVLHWRVIPEEAEISLTSSTGEPIIVDEDGNCEEESTNALEQAGENSAVAGIPPVGCASVQPMEDTTYTLTATVGDETVTQDLEIRVKGLAIDYFTAGGSQNLRVPSYPAEVELAWKVTPAEASVQISANPSIDLEQSALGAEGTMRVTVNQDTTFTLTASAEGQADVTAEVRVSSDLGAMNCDQFIIHAPTSPVFADEQVTLGWTLPAGAGMVTNVRVESSGEALAEVSLEAEDHAQVPAKAGYDVKFMNGAGAVICSKTASMPVAAFDEISSGKAVRVIKDNATEKAVAAYVGFDLDGFNGGKIKIAHYAPKAEIVEIDFFKALKGYDAVTGTFNQQYVEEMVKTFPVNAIAKSAGGKLFVATTGVVLYDVVAEDGTRSWKALTTLLRTDTEGDYPGSHPSCFGKDQPGKESRVRGEIVTMGQVCDMVVSDGTLYVATDRGLYTLNDVEGTITNLATARPQWQGRQSPLYGKIINDVAVVDGVVYTAGSMGVDRGGESLYSGGTAYSVAVTTGEEGETVVLAGVDGGVFVKRGDAEGEVISLDASHEAGEGISDTSPAYSVVVDPYVAGVIYVGTGGGFYVSRNGGFSFEDVTPVAEDGSRPVVRSVEVLYSSDPYLDKVRYYLYLATESGVMRAYLRDVKIVQPTVGSDPDAGGDETSGEEPQETEETEGTEGAESPVWFSGSTVGQE